MSDSSEYISAPNLCYFPGDGWTVAGGAMFCGKPLPCPEHGGRKGFVMDGSLLNAWVRLAEKTQSVNGNLLDDLRRKSESLAEYRADMVLLKAVVDLAVKDRDTARAEVKRLEMDRLGLEQAYEIAQSKEDSVRARLKTAENEMAELRDEILRLKDELHRQSMGPRDAIDL